MENIINVNNNTNIIKLNKSLKTIIKVEDNTTNNIVVLLDNFKEELIFNVGENVNITINTFFINSNISVTINFDKENSSVDFNSTILNSKSTDGKIEAVHNKNNTTSNMLIHALNKDMDLYLDVIGKVSKYSYKSVTNQDSKIINLSNDYPVSITPILLINNHDVVANHSGYVGSFDDEVLFYLKSRGINHDDSFNLLLHSFLLGILNIEEDIKKDLLKIIEKFMEE